MLRQLAQCPIQGLFTFFSSCAALYWPFPPHILSHAGGLDGRKKFRKRQWLTARTGGHYKRHVPVHVGQGAQNVAYVRAALSRTHRVRLRLRWTRRTASPVDGLLPLGIWRNAAALGRLRRDLV